MNLSPPADRLKELDVPDISFPLHQKRLRAALLHAHRQGTRDRELSSLSLSLLPSMFSSHKWQLLSASLFVIAAVLIVSGIKPFSTEAYAQNVVHNLIFHLNELSPAEREAVHDRMAANISTALLDAQNAPDLHMMPVQDFEKEMWDMHESMKALYPGMDFPSEPPMLHYKLAQILRYTDTRGKLVTIGIDGDSIPVMKMVGLTHADYAQFEQGVVPEDHLKLVP